MKPIPCIVPGCGRPSVAKGYCLRDYQAQRRRALRGDRPLRRAELEDSETLSVRVPREWLLIVEGAAEAQSQTVSHWVREAIRGAVLRAAAQSAGLRST